MMEIKDPSMGKKMTFSKTHEPLHHPPQTVRTKVPRKKDW